MTFNNIIIKILVDNKANAGLMKEHGFPVWIEVSGHRILFDNRSGDISDIKRGDAWL